METATEPRIKETTISPEGLSYHHDSLTEDAQQTLLRSLNELSSIHEMFRGRPLKRSYAQFGHAYTSTGRRVNAAPPLPDFLIARAEKAVPHCPPAPSFNQCIVTRYPEEASICWHCDAGSFGDCVIAVSLGSTARLQFAPCGMRQTTFELLVAPGSLYVMHGAARRSYDHRIVPVKEVRCSITFRRVVNTPQGPPVSEERATL